MIYKPPCNIAKRDFSKKYVFLAGTIEMGKSEDWQSDITSFFTDRGWGVFNPRRDDWDSNGLRILRVQSFNNKLIGS